MSWFSSFTHPQRGYQAGQKELDKYYNDAQGYQQPYNQNGQDQGKNLTDMINKLMNPTALQDEWSNNYKESDAAKNMENIATQHGVNAASSMGLGGSNSALNAIQSGTSNIVANDRQNYLNDLMEKYKTAAGLSQGVYNTGAQTAGQMGANAMNQGTNSAGMKFGETNAPGEFFGKTVGGLGKGLIDYLTGGFK